MRKDKRHILLTRKQIDNRSSDLSIEETNRFSALEADSLDGWNNSRILTKHGMKNLDSRYLFRIGIRNWKFNTLILFILSIIAIIIIWFKPIQSVNQTNESANKSVTEITLKLGSMNENTEVANPVKPNKSIIKMTNHEFNPTESLIQEDFESTMLPSLDKLTLDEQKKSRKLKRIKEIYIQNYKLVDYRGMRDETRSLNNLDLSGVSSEFSSKRQRDSIQTKYIEGVTGYYEFMKQTIIELAQGDTSSAIHSLSQILFIYPDDANALFYIGFLEFNKGNYTVASQWLIKSSSNWVSNFHEESMWYYAESLRLSGKTAKAKEIYLEIAFENGFYSNQAKNRIMKD